MKETIINFIKNKNFFWHMIGITINSFYPIFLIIFITRYNGIDISGLFSYVFYFAAFLSTIGSYGGRLYHVSDTNSEYSNSQYVTIRYLTSFLMILVGILFCIINQYAFDKFILILILLIFRLLESVADSYYGIMQKNGNLESVGKSFILKSFINFFLFLILDIVTNNIIIACFALIISNLFIFILYDKKIVRKYDVVRKKFNKDAILILKKCFPIFIFAFLQLFLLNITRYIVDIYLTNNAQGYFGILIAPAAVVAMFSQFVVQPSIKGLSESSNNGDYIFIKNKIREICYVLLAIGSIVAIVTYLIGPEIFSIVFGLRIEYRLELMLVVISGTFYGLSCVYSSIISIFRKFNGQLILYILSCLLAISFSLFLTKYYDLEGAILAFVVSMIIQSLMFFFMYRFTIIKLILNKEKRR